MGGPQSSLLALPHRGSHFLQSLTINLEVVLGLFSLKRKIEDDAVLPAKLMAASALELEEARRVKQEVMIRDYDL
ncbi:hypothetical protein SAY87_008091 [Trapa incisa]|uniref:Uncharacterized protein n=1 Tax=Trapa incisa TaxID=236973 RepID=A0AAN7KFH0_9MYRT|nr:hypothetical protein SAY87_008091 [Trapa incisa]